MKKLFGTDGVRGRANAHPIVPEMCVKIGRAAALFLGKGATKPEIVIGKDTRASGDMIESAVASGVCSAGMHAILAGVLPTPGIALLAARGRAVAGIVISASHNPHHDNGIKIFGHDGFKLPDEIEASIEKIVDDPLTGPGPETGRVRAFPDALDTYCDFLKDSLKHVSLSGMRVAVDCSNGATYQAAPKVLDSLGARARALFVSPDGKNINADCGSQRPETLAAEVVASGAAAGFAFDGDGDRCIAVDEKGNKVTGDQILLICAKHLHEKGLLSQDTVVSTVMSNLGFIQALERLGIRHVMADVGDRYVLEAMRANGARLGGEDSGHIIFLDRHTSGDGIFTALQILAVMAETGRPLSELAAAMEVFPQILLNVPVPIKRPLEEVPALQETIRASEKELGDRGRILVRYSGTRSVCRVMVEGPTHEETKRHAELIAQAVKRELGGP